jgi:transcriptional regulator with XRE-family HTH domain
MSHQIPLKETPKEQLEHLALRFQKYRLAANIPQEALAKAAGVGIATLRRFESGGNISARGLLALLSEVGRPLNTTLLLPLNKEKETIRQRARKTPPRTPEKELP